MSVGNLAPAIRQQWFNGGVPLSGGQLFSYQAGTTTPQNTYTDQSMGTPNTNPVILDVNGEADVWIDQALAYKFVLEDASGDVLWTVDNVVGLLAANAVSTSSIQDGAVTTAKLADRSVTSAKLANDASIDANRAVTTNSIKNTQVTGAKLAGSAVSMAGMCNIGLSTSVASNAMTVTLTDGSGGTPSAESPADVVFRNSTVTTGAPNLRQATSALTVVIPHLAKLTTNVYSGVNQDIWVYAIDNAGTVELAVAGSRSFDETAVQSTTAISSSSNSAAVLYSTTARTGVAVRLIGRLISNQTTSGVWASNATNVSVYSPNIYPQVSEVVLNGAAAGYGATNTMFRTFDQFADLLAKTGSDISYSPDASLGDSWVINTPGLYSMTYWDNFSAAQQFAITRNDNQGTTAMNSGTITNANVLAMASVSAANLIGTISVVEYLNAGDAIRCHTQGTSSGTNTANGQGFRIIRIP